MRVKGFSAVGIILLLLLACERKEYSSGEAIYREECARCHKLEAKPEMKGPDFQTILAKRNEDYFRKYTYDPRAFKGDSVMPGAELSDREMNLLLQYLKEKTGRVEK